MPSAYLLCGPSMAGKSNLCRQIVERVGATVSPADAINTRRGLPFGLEGLPESAWAETHRQQLLELQQAGDAGQSVIIDDTLCYRWMCDRFLEASLAAGLTPKLLLLRPSNEEVFARRENAMRMAERPVLSLLKLIAHLASFEWPDATEAAFDVTTTERQAAWLQEEFAARRNVS